MSLNNWAIKKFTDVLDIQGGTQPPKAKFISELKDGYIRLLQIRDFGNKPVPTFVPLEKKLKTCESDDILIGRYGASVGRICTGMSGAYNVALAKVIIPEKLYKKYVYYYLRSSLFQYPLTLIQRTAQNGFNKDDLSNIDFPFPPLDEQINIANKLDVIFSKLKFAQEKVQKLPEQLQRFRFSLMKTAFSGKSTEGKKYPKVNKDDTCEGPFELPAGWCWKPFGKVASIKSNLVKPQDHEDYAHIAPDNIEKYTGKLLPFRTIKEDNVKSPKHLFYPGQIIYSKIRPYLSKLVMVDFEGLCSADMYPIETSLKTEYLYFYMLSSTFLDFASNSGTRSVLPKINQKELSIIPVPVCSPEEQDEVICNIEEVINFSNNMEAAIKVTADKLELLERAVLKKAFNGELVNNSLESIDKLLNEIEEVAISINKSKKKVSKKKQIKK